MTGFASLLVLLLLERSCSASVGNYVVLSSSPSLYKYDIHTAAPYFYTQQANVSTVSELSATANVNETVGYPTETSPEDHWRELEALAIQRANLREEILRHILDGYEKNDRPPGPDATEVIINLKVVALFAVDVRTMEFSMDMLLRQNWVDRRLAWNHIPDFDHFNGTLVSPDLKNDLWLPDLFFRKGKEGYRHMITMPNYLIRVYPNGEVLYSQKITMRFACEMDLQTFPMDHQECDINIGSYGYELSELKFVWKDKDPVELPKMLEISEFETPEGFSTHDCSATYSTSTGNYTCLNATFWLKRQIGSYLATTYIPNSLIIMVSWLSFWVKVDSAPARVPLGLLTLLGILTQTISMTGSLPRVSYIRAIDVWMISSIVFVSGVLGEYAIALTMLRRCHVETWQQDVKGVVRQELTRWCIVSREHKLGRSSADQGPGRGHLEFCETLEVLLMQEANYEGGVVDSQSVNARGLPPGFIESEVDSLSRFLFPACFLLYNCLYWGYYLMLAGRQDTETNLPGG